MDPQKTQVVAKTIGCSPQTDRKAPLLKTTTTTLTQLIELKGDEAKQEEKAQ